MRDEFNILIVEDDEKTFKTLRDVLADTNYKVLRVTTAKEALNLAKEVHFMAVITEIHIPGMEGIELIRRLQKINARINIIVLTTSSFVDSAIKALEAGAYAYLLKPLNIEEVKVVLKRTIENTCLLIQAGKKKYYQDMSILDGLTGVYNHRYFHDMLEWQVSHLRRFPQAFSLIMIDIDDFKKYNDSRGHLEGDKVLHNAAQLFVNCTRDGDLIFRYGGEEFTIILPQTRLEHARKVGERLIQAARTKLPVTISIGLATFPDHAQTKDDLINSADKALYQAKGLGKNKICIYKKSLDE